MNERCLRIYFSIIVAAVLALACSPKDSQVNSPGAGNRWKFVMVSGNNQSTGVMETLVDPLVVKLTTLTGDGIDNEDIRFKVVYGNGQVQKPVSPDEAAEFITITNFEGIASTQFLNFGGDSLGVSRVRAEVMDSTQFWVEFTIGTI